MVNQFVMLNDSFGSEKWNGRLARSIGNSGNVNGRGARSTILQTCSTIH